MHSHNSHPSKGLTAIALALVAALLLAACGSSSPGTTSSNAASSGSTTTGNAGAPGTTGTAGTTGTTGTPGTPGTPGTTGTTGTPPPPGGRGARFTALRECLKKDGITLPSRRTGTPGTGTGTSAARPPAAGPLGGAGALPKGVTRSQFEADLKKCGGGSFGRFGSRSRFGGANFKKALEKFATCMRQNGVNVPNPNTSGTGPVFDTKGINVKSSKFLAARKKCQSLIGRLAGPGAAGGGAPPAGAPSSP